MKSATRFFGGLITITILLLAGCQRPLNREMTIKMEPGDVQMFSVDAPRSAQKVKVKVTTDGLPLNVYIVEEKDQEMVRRELLDLKKPSKYLKKMEGLLDKKSRSTATIETTIPAKTGFAVVLAG